MISEDKNKNRVYVIQVKNCDTTDFDSVWIYGQAEDAEEEIRDLIIEDITGEISEIRNIDEQEAIAYLSDLNTKELRELWDQHSSGLWEFEDWQMAV